MRYLKLNQGPMKLAVNIFLGIWKVILLLGPPQRKPAGADCSQDAYSCFVAKYLL